MVKQVQARASKTYFGLFWVKTSKLSGRSTLSPVTDDVPIASRNTRTREAAWTYEPLNRIRLVAVDDAT
jgi:hypothetical protein